MEIHNYQQAYNFATYCWERCEAVPLESCTPIEQVLWMVRNLAAKEVYHVPMNFPLVRELARIEAKINEVIVTAALAAETEKRRNVPGVPPRK